MPHIDRRNAAAIALGALVLMGGAGRAEAHQQRLIAGKYSFEVGWGDEPAYAGFKNSVQLTITDAAHRPVTDVTDTMKVEVVSGTDRTTLALTPNFEAGESATPGDYRAWLIPTRAGDYTFHFTGTIRGDKIDESFTSSETTFSPVKNAADAQFPAKVPAGGELAQRIERDSGRLAAATERAANADDKAATATTVALVGVVAGVLGLVLAVVALARRSRGTPAP